MNKITILTGKNGSGKSLIRKILPKSVGDSASTSQERRTSNNPEWGALSSAMCDVGGTPTSTETLSHIQQLLQINNKYIIIDEPEIGMGEETVAGLLKLLNEELPKHKNNGICFITHNRYIVEHLNADAFYNIEGMTKEEWLIREIIPTDLNKLKDDSMALFKAIQQRINENKSKL